MQSEQRDIHESYGKETEGIRISSHKDPLTLYPDSKFHYIGLETDE